METKPGLREDSLQWALKLGTPRTAEELVRDAQKIHDYVYGAGESVTGDRVVDYIQSEVEAHEKLPSEVWSSQHVVSVLNSILHEMRHGRVDWGEVAQVTDLEAERDRARATAVQLEQELAERTRELNEARDNLTKGVLLEAMSRAKASKSPQAISIVEGTARHFGVTL